MADGYVLITALWWMALRARQALRQASSLSPRPT